MIALAPGGRVPTWGGDKLSCICDLLFIIFLDSGVVGVFNNGDFCAQWRYIVGFRQ